MEDLCGFQLSAWPTEHLAICKLFSLGPKSREHHKSLIMCVVDSVFESRIKEGTNMFPAFKWTREGVQEEAPFNLCW